MTEFELVKADAKTAEETDPVTLGELKQRKFRMRVNNKSYDIYPDLLSIAREEPIVSKNKKEIAKLDKLENSIAISRQTMLRDYYPLLVSAMKKEAATGGKLSKEKLDKAFKASIK